MIRNSFVNAINSLTNNEDLTPFQKSELLKDLDWRFGPYDEITVDDVEEILNDLIKAEVLYTKSSSAILELTKSNMAA